jgi:NADH-quinone oxidoreductase subunit A
MRMPSWIGVVVLILLSLLFGVVSLVASRLIKPSRSSATKLEAYESGIRATGDTRGRHSVHFYLVAMLFLVFDVELAFMYPWVLYFNMLDEKLFMFIEVVVFLGILLVGYIWAWRKGALDWNR